MNMEFSLVETINMFFSLVIGPIVIAIWTYFRRNVNISESIDAVKKVAPLKYALFSLRYIIPLCCMAYYIIFSDETGSTAIYFFILNCFFIFYNLVMGHIINLYKMFKKLTDKTASDFKKVDNTLGYIRNKIE